MKTRIALAALLAATALTACIKDDTIYYNITEMGVVKDGKILSDSGITYTIVESTSAFTLDGIDRLIFFADVLRSSGTNAAYDIRLKDFYPVPVDDIRLPADLPEGEMADDAVSILNAWFGGGYLNLDLVFFTKEDSETVHEFTLVAENLENTADTLRLRLYHDAAGEAWNDDTIPLEETGLQTDGTYCSFPLKTIAPTSGSRPLKITYTWHTYEDDIIACPTRQYSLQGDLLP